MQFLRRFHENFTQISRRFNAEFHAEYFAKSVRNPCGLSWRNLGGISTEFHPVCKFHALFMKISRRFLADSMYNSMQNTFGVQFRSPDFRSPNTIRAAKFWTNWSFLMLVRLVFDQTVEQYKSLLKIKQFISKINVFLSSRCLILFI